MARPGRPERNRAARSFRQLRRFHHGINSNKVFGIHNGKPIQLGPFTVFPRLVDHSGFDACAMEVQADGKRLFYSGALISIAAPCHGRSIVRERSTKVFGENLRELVAEAATSAASLQVPCSGFWRTPTPRILLQDHSD